MKVLPAGLLWLVVAVAAALSLQSSTSSGAQSSMPARAVVAGIVTKDPGSEPVKKALIELIAESQSDGGNYTALSGVDGGFRIENILPGRYRLFVERTGYQEVDKHQRRSEGRVLTLGGGQELKDLVIRLQAAAVVEGRVTDEDGDPMAEAQVALLRQTFVAGRSHWEQAGAERTNDLGDYRIAGLAAGNYFVSVTPPPDFRSLIETTGNAATPRNAASSEKPAPAAYQTTYYPGTLDRGQAQPVQLHAGDDFPANFSLTKSPTLTIRGSVVNLPPGTTAAIMLQSKDFSLVLNGAEMHRDGSFEIRDVSPGAYTIFATVDNAAVPMLARQSLQITSANVDGLQLAPQAGGSIRGRLRMEAGSVSRPDASQMFLLLRSADGDDDALGGVAVREGSPTLAHVNADGSFEWKNVSAGRYYVQLSDASDMPDWFLKSVAAGGREVADSGFSVSGGSTNVDVLASANGARADGVATNQKDEPVADAAVVAVPEARFRTHPDRYRKASTDQSGRFTLRGLPPGDYTIFAWESIDGDAYYNPEFLASYEGRGRALHVSEGDRTSLQLKVIPVAEDQQ
ncbi:MAG: carboxypeptidase-like regulatory domain-containing protein [Candidatus Sulfotelmatobacter sp.]